MQPGNHLAARCGLIARLWLADRKRSQSDGLEVPHPVWRSVIVQARELAYLPGHHAAALKPLMNVRLSD